MSRIPVEKWALDFVRSCRVRRSPTDDPRVRNPLAHSVRYLAHQLIHEVEERYEKRPDDNDPRCKQPLPSGGRCGGVDAHVPECPRNELREEFDRQDEERRMPSKLETDLKESLGAALEIDKPKPEWQKWNDELLWEVSATRCWYCYECEKEHDSIAGETCEHELHMRSANILRAFDVDEGDFCAFNIPTAHRVVDCMRALAGVPDPAAWVAAANDMARAVRARSPRAMKEALAVLDRAAGGEGEG